MTAHHEKWARKMASEAASLRLRRARAAVMGAQAQKRSAVLRARELCAAARASTREWVARARLEVRAEIARLRAELAAAIEHKRGAVRACCGPDKQRARAEADERIAAAREALAAQQRATQLEHVWRRPDKAARSSREKIEHSDQEVEANLSPDELIVWRAVRKRLSPATAHVSKLERLQHWMHDHSADVAEILAADAERSYQQAVRDEERERAQLREWQHAKKLAKRTHSELRAMVVNELDAVPF